MRESGDSIDRGSDASQAPQGAFARLATHRVLIAGLAVVLVAMVAMPLVVLRLRPEAAPKMVATKRTLTMADALSALESGDYSLARRRAEQLRQILPADQGGSAAFVLGATAAREAEEFLGREQNNLFLLAAGHLQEAEQLGFPEQHRGEGLFLLGKSLVKTGRYVEARAPLEEALPQNDDHTRQLHWLLALAYSKGEHRDLTKALAHIESYLGDTELDIADRHAGLLEQLRMYYQAGDVAGCEFVLARIPREATIYPDAELIRGRLSMKAAARMKRELKSDSSVDDKTQVTEAYNEAIRIFRHAQDDPLGSQAIRRSMYLIGHCFLEMDDYQAALTQFERTRNVWLDTQEGLAAGLEEADLLRRAGRTDDAIAAYQRVLAAVRAPFDNAWIEPDEFRSRVMAAYRQLIDEAQFEKAEMIAEYLAPLFPPAQAAKLSAEALRIWSAKLMVEAEGLPEIEASVLRQKSRTMLRKAGRLFADVAQIEFSTREYPDDLWRSAVSFLEGHDFRSAVAAFEEYLKHESRKQRPRALIHLGECYLALNRLDEALAACQECIEFHPTDPSGYQARLITSKVYVEKGDNAAAENVLRENLNGDFLAPASREWRESLFRLGELLQSTGRYDEAIRRLREAVERYPDAPESVRARYLIAESYRHLAKNIQDKLQRDSNDTTRAAQRKELQSALTSSIEYYEQVKSALSRQQERAPLSMQDNLILRNALFAEGDAWFNLERYDSAISAYSTIINRYQHDPEALEAFVQIASCYRRWNKPVEARGAIEHAKLVLRRMDPDAPFTKVTNNTRREWQDLLEWLATL